MKSMDIHSKLFDYTVAFTTDFTRQLSRFDQAFTAWVIDRNVYRLYESRLTAVKQENLYLVDAVESKKNMDTVMDIILFWKSIGVHKNWRVVCLGGGITQDLTTMASDLYLRNLDWYFFPTTLLAMCDSCIGGKCGINLGQFKNQIGVFYPPKEIVIDPAFLDTTSHEDYLNGWGELLKFSLTDDPDFYAQLKREPCYIPNEQIGEYISRGLLVKKRVIEADEFESDLRRVLNYGHTFGLEAYTNNRIPHGKGVIWGIDVVNYIAWREGLIDQALYLDVKELIKTAFLQEEIVIGEPQRLFDIIKTDKKVRNDTLSFAMLDGPSHLIVYPMKIDEKLLGYFAEYLEQTHAYYCT